MSLSKLERGELVAMVGGFLLAVSIFVKAYEARPENANANIDGKGVGGCNATPDLECHDSTFSYFEVHDLTRILLLAAAIAPFILAWIIIREHQLSWPRGQLTAVVAIAALGIIFYMGVIDRPGEPSGEIELEIGWYGMMLGAILMLAGSVIRSSESGTARRPPGTF